MPKLKLSNAPKMQNILWCTQGALDLDSTTAAAWWWWRGVRFVGAFDRASPREGAAAAGAGGSVPPTGATSSLHIVPSSSSLKKQVQTSSGMIRQVASADEASDSEDIDVCETCSEWLSKALLCSCQVPSSASSSPSQGQQHHTVGSLTKIPFKNKKSALLWD